MLNGGRGEIHKNLHWVALAGYLGHGTGLFHDHFFNYIELGLAMMSLGYQSFLGGPKALCALSSSRRRCIIFGISNFFRSYVAVVTPRIVSGKPLILKLYLLDLFSRSSIREKSVSSWSQRV